MITNQPNASRVIRLRSTLFGEFVEIEFPFSFLEPEEAEALAQLLLETAAVCRVRRTAPPTISLPLSEAFSLETAGASVAQTRQSIQSVGDNFGGAA